MEHRIWTPEYAEQMVCHEFDPDGDVTLVLTIEDLALGSLDEEDSEIGDPEKHSGLFDRRHKPKAASSDKSEVWMRVSSRHLVLASSVFKAMLSNRFREGTELHSAGTLLLYLPDDDPVTLSIILNIVHGYPMMVPRRVDDSLLVALAVLVDKYQLQDVMAMFTELWITDIMAWWRAPVAFGEDLITWLFVSYVFRREDEFRRVTAVCQRYATSRISEDLTEGLAIPESLIDSIENFRVHAIGSALGTTRAILEDYQGPTAQCKHPSSAIAFKCDGMALGGMIRNLAKAGIWPEPPPPYAGLSFDMICKTLRSLEDQKYCMKSAAAKDSSSHCRYFCGTINECLVTEERVAVGLSLDKFLR